ncbi:MAG: 50S ribosomal protein L5 [uncultured bacterium]|nr:MAG: 50S ribosomal protein L5 [uncultured bacterium]
MTPRLQERYSKEIQPKLMTEFGIANRLAAPHLLKITLNVGVGKAMGDKKIIDAVTTTLTRISGQKPVATKARKSISNFKLRQGTVVGLMVTLRGKRMYEFMDKLINVTLPRVRDFQGIKRTAVDAQGNLNIGFKEHLVFPEIKSDSIDAMHGLEAAFSTTAKNREQGLRLFELFGIPFKK